MAQYIPCGQAKRFAELSRPITRREYDKVLEKLFALGLDGYVQERSAASKAFIPSFDLEGVQFIPERQETAFLPEKQKKTPKE